MTRQLQERKNKVNFTHKRICKNSKQHNIKLNPAMYINDKTLRPRWLFLEFKSGVLSENQCA